MNFDFLPFILRVFCLFLHLERNLFENKNHILDVFLLSTDYPKFLALGLCTINLPVQDL